MMRRMVVVSVLFSSLVLSVFFMSKQAVQADLMNSSIKPTPSLKPAKKSPSRRPPKRQNPSAASPKQKKANRPPLFLANANGNTYLIHHGKKKKIHPPQRVGTKDSIVTGKNGKAYLEFQRGGTIEIGPKSDIKVKELDITPKTFKVRFQLAFGKMKTAVHKLTRSSSLFEIEAGGVVSGVRGTVFEVDYDKDKKQEATKTFEGTVYAEVNGKEQLVENGRSMEVDAGGVPLMEALTEEDAKGFQEFVNVSNDLDDKKETLLEQVEQSEENNQSEMDENGAPVSENEGGEGDKNEIEGTGTQENEKNMDEKKDDKSDKKEVDEDKTSENKESEAE